MIQNSATLIKVGALALVAWACLSSLSVSWATFILVEGFVVLLAFLDAGQAVPAGAGREQAPSEADVGAVGRRLLGVAVGPFYLVLAALAGVGMWDKMQTGAGAAVVAEAASHAGGCGSGGGCGSKGGCGSGGCGASSGGSCGCSSKKGSSKAVAAPAGSTNPAAKPMPPRSMPAVAPAKLPGLGPNGRPLPAGLVPRPGVALPPGVEVAAPVVQPPGTIAVPREAAAAAPEPVQTPAPVPEAAATVPADAAAGTGTAEKSPGA